MNGESSGDDPRSILLLNFQLCVSNWDGTRI